MRAWPAVIVAILASALSACSDADESRSPVSTPKAVLAHSNFADCDELREFYARGLVRQLLHYGDLCWGCSPLSPARPGVPSWDRRFEADDAGAPEPQLMVMDPATGRFYLARGSLQESELVTVHAVPAESMSVSSRVDTTGGLQHSFNRGLYLDAVGRRLVLVTPRAEYPSDVDYWRESGSWRPGAEVQFFDITDPDQPVLTHRYQVSGSLIGARRAGQRLHLVTGEDLGLPRSLAESAAFRDLLARYRSTLGGGIEYVRLIELSTDWIAREIRQRVHAAVGDAPLADLLPVWRQGLDVGPSNPRTPLACTEVRRPQIDAYLSFVTISSIDMDGTGLAQLGTVNHAWEMEAASEHLYLVEHSNAWWWHPSQAQQSAIHRYRLEDGGAVQPDGSGVVDGWAHAVSEYGGYLRVLTAQRPYYPGEPGWRPNANHLFVLGSTLDGPLEVVGEVRDFATGIPDSIIGVRAQLFDGDRIFAGFGGSVPIYAFDVSDPAQPWLAGLLPTVASIGRMRSTNEDRLLALGTETMLQDSKVHLLTIDVATLTPPTQISDLQIGAAGEHASSQAMQWPDALTLAGDLLVVPVEVRAGAGIVFQGFIAYRIELGGTLTELGRVGHDIVAAGWLANAARFDEPGGRTVLYTLGSNALKADAVGETIEPIASVPLD